MYAWRKFLARTKIDIRRVVVEATQRSGWNISFCFCSSVCIWRTYMYLDLGSEENARHNAWRRCAVTYIMLVSASEYAFILRCAHPAPDSAGALNALLVQYIQSTSRGWNLSDAGWWGGAPPKSSLASHVDSHRPPPPLDYAPFKMGCILAKE